ncbi:hypothetical protein ACQP2Y_21960 [Actinoplanes sp. CA-051413]|uniref:hypothetical protein n=1 Tax=Actinoplanes sp. CA-051413 TaxID=3239899 RepID=UPI003D966ED0
MSTDCIATHRSPEPGVTPVIDPARLSWGPWEEFQQVAKADTATSRYWSTRVFRPAHNIAHPAVMADCPGCRYETAVAA